MSWGDIISKLLSSFKLIEMNPKGQQIGLLNIQGKNNTYNYSLNFSNPETAKAFAKEISNQQLVQNAKEKVTERLSSAIPTPDLLSPSTAEEVAAWAVGDSLFGELNMKGEVHVNISPKKDDEF